MVDKGNPLRRIKMVRLNINGLLDMSIDSVIDIIEGSVGLTCLRDLVSDNDNFDYDNDDDYDEEEDYDVDDDTDDDYDEEEDETGEYNGDGYADAFDPTVKKNLDLIIDDIADGKYSIDAVDAIVRNAYGDEAFYYIYNRVM